MTSENPLPEWRQRQEREMAEVLGTMLDTPEGRKWAGRDMIWKDHGFVRAIYPNRHRLGRNAWRAAQPSPGQVAFYARQGVKTIISLRGGRQFGSLPLEMEACETAGITFMVQRLFSRSLPHREELQEFIAVIRAAEAPVLYHCKSGADRAGFASAIHLHLIDGVPVEEAKEQLALRYLHVRQAKTGILDYFFDAFLAWRGNSDRSLEEWIATDYDPGTLRDAFEAKRGQTWAWLVDQILRRE